jgi:hypothetical protein
MPSEPIYNPEDAASLNEDEQHMPFDGFVNVNALVERRRQLRNAHFNVSDEAWDEDLNLQPKEGPDEHNS